MRNVALAIVSTIVGIVLVNIAANRILDPGSVYSSFHAVPELNQWHNEVTFWSRYAEHPERADFSSYDPVLGWDFDAAGDRIRGSRKVAHGRQPATTRLVALGDSFVYGTDVEPNENFSALLGENYPGTEVLNMGVPGYGIDQAFLKYVNHGAAYQPDAIVFGIYVSDYERSSMAFTWAAKPRFIESADGFVIENQPVPNPEDELARISSTLQERNLLLDLVRNGWRKLTVGAQQEQTFFDTTDRVVTHLLRSLRDSLTDHQDLVIVHIPRAEAFIENDAFRDEMSQRLLAIYDSLQLSYIDLGEEFVADTSPEAVYGTHYVQRSNGSMGHLSPLGHQRAADLLAAVLGLD